MKEQWIMTLKSIQYDENEASESTLDTEIEYYKTPDGENTAEITVTLPRPADVSRVVLKEHIPLSQWVERFAVDVRGEDGSWREAASGTTVGYKRIVRFSPVRCGAVRVRVTDSRVCPVLSFIGVY